MNDSVPRVRFESISKRYPGVQALDSVSFEIAAGSVHALVGENGAGKSTLVKILAGATPADEGSVLLDGRRVNLGSARQAALLGIAVVYQEFSLAADLTVAENVFLGRWPRGTVGTIDFADLHRRSESLLESLGVSLSTTGLVGELSVAQQQMVEIARALSMRANVLMLDEPSAVLSPQEGKALFEVVRRLAAQGVSVLYISHRLDEIFELCDRVTVLRDGRHVSTRVIGEADREALIREMVGRPISEEFPSRRATVGRPVLHVERLSVGQRVRDVSFDVREGEVFALTGLVGSGRSSVGGAVFGAASGVTGRVAVGETEGPFRSPRKAKAAGVALVPEDRRRQGLLLQRSVRENVSLANLRGVSRGGFLRQAAERMTTRRWMDEFQIKAVGPEALAGTLSGGNQQKAMIARWLQRPCRVIILDEPTRGVDVGAKVEIYAIINRLAERGTAVVMITSEFPEAMGMADRIGVMAGGRLRAVLDNRSRGVTQEAILQRAVPDSTGNMRESGGASSI